MLWRAHCCKRHTPCWKLSQLSLEWACFAVASKNSSMCFHHRQLTIAYRDVFLEETWQDVSHLPLGEQLDGLPLMPRSQLLSAEPRSPPARWSRLASLNRCFSHYHTFNRRTLSTHPACNPHCQWVGRQGKPQPDAYLQPACPAPGPQTSPGRCSSQCLGRSSSGTH